MVAPHELKDFSDLIDALSRPTVLTELAVLAACVLGAWAVARLARGAAPKPGSIWFGDRIVDGVLFPVLALGFALVARRELTGVVPLAVFRVAMPVLTSLVIIRLVVKVLGVAFPKAAVVRVVERSVSWLAWGAVVLWVTGLFPMLLEEMQAIRFRVGATQVNLRDVVEGVLSAVFLLVIALWISAAVEARLLKGVTGAHLSVRKIAANGVRAVLLFVGLLMGLAAAGIDLTALSVVGGAVGVGIGFGLQKLAANYISGFVVLAEQSLRIGDLVKIDGFEGRVTDINARYTVIRSMSGRESIVPNEMLITQRVENASLADSELLMSTVVQVAYGTDLDRLRPALIAEANQVSRVVRPEETAVHLTAFAADGLELTVFFWLGDPERGQSSVRSEVNLAILRVIGAQGVEIPYPQRVLRRLDESPAPASVPPPPAGGIRTTG